MKIMLFRYTPLALVCKCRTAILFTPYAFRPDVKCPSCGAVHSLNAEVADKILFPMKEAPKK